MICVLGRSGQVASALSEISAERSMDLRFFGRDQADFLCPEKVRELLELHQPSVVINTAAFTAVDQAESNSADAFTLNAETPKVVAEWCRQSDASLIHFSSDYVYDGSGQMPRAETAPTGPLNVYGQSKLAGDLAIAASGAKHVILRTSWVYHHQGQNFVKTMLRLGAERDDLSVVADQVGAPTYAIDLAAATLDILRQIQSPEFAAWGVYHATASGETTWHGFALRIFKEASALGLPLKIRVVKPIATSEYRTPAQRPLNSRLSNEKLQSRFGLRLPSWEDSLKTCLQKIASGRTP